MTVYLDHNATTAVRPEARDAMLDVMSRPGNPSSIHSSGRKAKGVLERAREAIARSVRARAEDVVFTSGGTEANNLAVFSACEAGAKTLIVSAVEHSAVMAAAEASGVAVEILPVNEHGVADLDWLAQRLNGETSTNGPTLVSLMAANNETGVIQPVEAAGRIVREAGALFHVDAVQALGKVDYNVAASLAHYTAFSAHKVGGPQGVGALVLDCDAPVTPRMIGGGQEKGRRCGTENLPGIAGFAAAVEAAVADRNDFERLIGLRDHTIRQIRVGAPDLQVWGEVAERLPNTICMSVEGWSSEIQVIAMDLAGFAVSAGSACSSGKIRRSRVLEAMGASETHAASALRVSFGYTNTKHDAEAFADAWLSARAKAQRTLATAS